MKSLYTLRIGTEAVNTYTNTYLNIFIRKLAYNTLQSIIISILSVILSVSLYKGAYSTTNEILETILIVSSLAFALPTILLLFVTVQIFLATLITIALYILQRNGRLPTDNTTNTCLDASIERTVTFDMLKWRLVASQVEKQESTTA